MFYCGIDPGQSGAIVIIDDKESIQYWGDLSDKLFDYARHIEGALEFKESLKVAIEDVHALPQQSTVAGFKFGYNCGLAHFLAFSLDPFYIKVTPQKWKKFFGLKKETYESKGDFKAKSIAKAKEFFVDFDSFRASRDGRAEAALIALYLKRNIKALNILKGL